MQMADRGPHLLVAEILVKKVPVVLSGHSLEVLKVVAALEKFLEGRIVHKYHMTHYLPLTSGVMRYTSMNVTLLSTVPIPGRVCNALPFPSHC